ncbi:hypothetical protein [Nonomuraea typhae]|uniref:hypothetical protein n=1 Tax=Nonomuraea typhae TaxID=2603600 RepID=UPI0015E1BF7A|nr:hypothetical protein [Nonomuraea typhae]
MSRALADRAAHFDLTGRKLQAFPAEVLRMPWLRTLIPDGNLIDELELRDARYREHELTVQHDLGRIAWEVTIWLAACYGASPRATSEHPLGVWT